MTLTLHEHPFAAYCWKPLVALFERDVPFERHFVGGEADRARLANLASRLLTEVLESRISRAGSLPMRSPSENETPVAGLL